MHPELEETDGLLTRLFGAAIDEGAWRVEIANENDLLLEDLIDEDVDAIVVMVYGKKKKTGR